MFEKFDIEKVKATEKRNIVLSVRATKEQFNWLKTNRVSASKLFDYAINEIMTKEVENKTNGKQENE